MEGRGGGSGRIFLVFLQKLELQKLQWGEDNLQRRLDKSSRDSGQIFEEFMSSVKFISSFHFSHPKTLQERKRNAPKVSLFASPEERKKQEEERKRATVEENPHLRYRVGHWAAEERAKEDKKAFFNKAREKLPQFFGASTSSKGNGAGNGAKGKGKSGLSEAEVDASWEAFVKKARAEREKGKELIPDVSGGAVGGDGGGCDDGGDEFVEEIVTNALADGRRFCNNCF